MVQNPVNEVFVQLASRRSLVCIAMAPRWATCSAGRARIARDSKMVIGKVLPVRENAEGQRVVVQRPDKDFVCKSEEDAKRIAYS